MDFWKEAMTMVVPYIGTWIETYKSKKFDNDEEVVPYIGTWIETWMKCHLMKCKRRRTLYRYVD